VGLSTHRQGLAAGVAWRADAIVTCASALGRHGRLQVLLQDGSTLTAELSGIDAGTDLALLRLPEGSAALPLPERHHGDTPRVGDAVFAAGRDSSGTLHASFGHLGKVGGPFRTWRGGAVDALLRLDGGLYPGLAGAPVATDRGLWLGLASPALSRHHGVVLPLATIDRVATALFDHGRVHTGYLGIAAQPVALNASMQAAADSPQPRGLLLAGIADAGPAARAGLLVGDVLVRAGGRPLADIDDLRTLLANEPAGGRVALTLLRGGQRLELSAEVAEHPAGRRC
jgi:serine protease Do